MKEYKSHFVAFLDILGFKELITKRKCDEIYPIFGKLHEKAKSQLNYNGVQIKAFDHIRHMILSDSIILFIDSTIDDAFAALIDTCRRLQYSLADRDEPILMRGGIAKGDLFYENDIIYGDGLTKAYLLESNLAKYPRIVFSGETLNEGFENTKFMFPDMEFYKFSYSKDDDYMYFVNYLPSLLGKTIDEVVEYSDRLKELCNCWLNKEIPFSLREKYVWLQNKVEKTIECMPNVREVYEKRQFEKFEHEDQKYNERFKIYKEARKQRSKGAK